jgi:hypothetical protein
MTTSQGAGTPAKQPAGAAEATGSELSTQPMGNAEAAETVPLTGHIAAPPNDLRQLEAEIERTRERLGETVQELVARADVKSLARAKTAELSGRVKDTTSRARKTAWQATPEQVRRAATNGASGAKEHWVPVTLAATSLTLGCLALRRWRRLQAPARVPDRGP